MGSGNHREVCRHGSFDLHCSPPHCHDGKMSDSDGHIQHLSATSRAQISSASAITSLGEAAVGLVQNALDARPASIEIELDFSQGFCMVKDDGVGIQRQNFEEDGCLGQMHCSSSPAFICLC